MTVLPVVTPWLERAKDPPEGRPEHQPSRLTYRADPVTVASFAAAVFTTD
jgi:hypothetical protein